jgi:hypothetical protein
LKWAGCLKLKWLGGQAKKGIVKALFLNAMFALMRIMKKSLVKVMNNILEWLLNQYPTLKYKFIK